MPDETPGVGQIGEKGPSKERPAGEQAQYKTLPQLRKDRYAQTTGYLRQENQLRLRFAFVLFVLVLLWLLAVLGVLIWQGLLTTERRLSDPVLIALLSTTTANVLGLLLAVTRYLFPSQTAGARKPSPRPKKT